ncbi:MAG: hypothetical protein K2L82_02205 [Lachnospiraceae bacterium]|nr:hypothetical protein [Lachnospiraceae bacterium]
MISGDVRCGRALMSLKYFYEEAPEYHIIVAGSLLDVAMNRTQLSAYKFS